MKVVFWAGQLIFWPIALYLCITLAGNFLTAPLGFKSKNLPPSTNVLAWVAVVAGALSFAVKLVLHELAETVVAGSATQMPTAHPPSIQTPIITVTAPDENEEIFKDGWYATRTEHRRRDEGLAKRRLSGARALVVHADLIAEAKRLCAIEGLICDDFGGPQDFDSSSTSTFQAAQRIAEAYRPILLGSLRNAIGDELTSKLGEPEKYIYPCRGSAGHERVLAYCKIEFKHADRSVFAALPVPDSTPLRSRNADILPGDNNIEIGHVASFGIFDPGCGEQYIPGDLRIIVGVKTVDDVTSYYRWWWYQVNPTANNFLKDLVNVDLLPKSAATLRA